MPNNAIILSLTQLPQKKLLLSLFNPEHGEICCSVYPTKHTHSFFHPGALIQYSHSAQTSKNTLQSIQLIRSCQNGGYLSLLARDALVSITKKIINDADSRNALFSRLSLALQGIETKPIQALSWFCEQYLHEHHTTLTNDNSLFDWYNNAKNGIHAIKDITEFKQQFLTTIL